MNAAGLFEGEWLMSDANDGTLLIRSMAKLPDEAARAGHPVLVLVSWTYGGEQDCLPDTETFAAIQGFEDALYADLRDEWGVEAATVTGNGVKEWRFYTGDPGLFAARFSEALAAHPPFPVELTAFDDPEWQALAELLPCAQH